MKRLTPKRAIEAECRECCGNQHTYHCRSAVCWLGGNELAKLRPHKNLERIKLHCAECAPNKDPHGCDVDGCHLHHYRFGRNPRASAAAKRRDVSHLMEYQFNSL